MAQKVLVIEDEKPLANALVLKLGESGFVAQAVYNGQAGLDLLTKEPFDLVVLDLVLPQMDGFAFLAELQKRKMTVPVIISSNLSQNEDIQKALTAGAVDYFVKSDVPLADVIEKVKKVLAAHAHR